MSSCQQKRNIPQGDDIGTALPATSNTAAATETSESFDSNNDSPQRPLRYVCNELKSTHLATPKRVRLEENSAPTIAANDNDDTGTGITVGTEDNRSSVGTPKRPANTTTADKDAATIGASDSFDTAFMGTPKRARIENNSASTSAAVAAANVASASASGTDTDTAIVTGGDSIESNSSKEEYSLTKGITVGVADKKEEKEDLMSLASAASLDFDSSDNESLDGRPVEDTAPSSAVNMARSFDMSLLQFSIRTGSLALNQVEGKDVIMIVGKTGTGKSTLIQGLAGKRIRPAVYTTTYNGQRVQKHVFEAEDPLPGFDIGHAKTSKTKAILSYERNIESDTNNDRTVLYLDSPGFEDTEGHEVDIATSVMLSQVAKRCKSLRFCVLIHYASLLEDRGGAIRAILKFTRNFVKDFNEEKQSFVFLFTHTNEISMESSDGLDNNNNMAGAFLDQARAHLLQEIVRTLEETKDEDVKTVLEFMRKCLKRQFPLVDILHPLKTNFMELRNALETKLKTVKNPTLAVNCGLTMASRSKLLGEVTSLRLSLRHYLSSDSHADTAKINEIRETLRYLAQHIEVADIQEAALASETLVGRHCAAQNDLIRKEIERGTDLLQPFTSQNAQALSMAVRQLLDLGSSLTEDHFSNLLEREVLDHYKDALKQPFGEFRGALLQLDKLHAWTEVFSTFGAVYQTARARWLDHIGDHQEIVSALDPAAMEGAPPAVINRLVNSISTIELLGAHQKALFRHEISLEEALNACKAAKEKIGSVVSSWSHDQSTMMDLDQLDTPTLQSLASRAKCLDVLSTQFEKSAACPELVISIQSGLADLEVRLVGHFQEAAATLAQLDLPLNEDGLQSLQRLKEASRHLGGLKGERWREIQFFYSGVLSNIRSSLAVIARELDRTTLPVRQHGLVNGKSHGASLASFDTCVRLDEFFDPKDRFVKCCSIKYHRIYDDRIDQVVTNAKEQFNNLFLPSTDSVQVLRDLGSTMSEIRQISEFVAAAGGKRWSKVESYVDDELKRYAETVARRTTEALVQWKSALDEVETKKIRLCTGKLNRLLCELDALLQLDQSNPRASSLKHEISASLAACNTKIMSEIGTSTDYSALSKLLACADAFDNFVETARYLPKLESMVQVVSLTVSNDARKIEDMVTNSAEWDVIDKELEKFKEAVNVDQFIGGQAGSRLGPLLKLREQKEADVDEHLESMIMKEDFKCIGELLVPLAQSSDQLKRQKFDRYQRLICSSLRSRIEELDRFLSSTISEEGVKKIANGYEKLMDADKEIGTHLRTHLDLHSEILRLKCKVNDEVQEILDQALESCSRADFANMAVFRYRSDLFWVHLEECMYKKSQKKRKQILLSCRRAKNGIPGLVEKFVDSSFVDAANLFGALSSLRKCAESDHESMSELKTLYESIQTDLLEKTNKLLSGLDKVTDETKCYDSGIPVLQALARQLQDGLHIHMNEDDLIFNYREKLRTWKAEQKAQDQYLHLEGADVEQKLQSLSAKLDNLKSPGVLRAVERYWTGTSPYEKERKKLSDKVIGILADALRALQHRDLKMLQERISILTLAKEKLAKHVGQVSADLKNLQDRVTNAFISLADQMKQALEERRLSQFEGHFVEFKSFIKNVPQLLGHNESKKVFALVNQLTYEVLDSQIEQVLKLSSVEEDSFDFLELKSAVEAARSFGGFVADNFTLLHEEVKSVDHAGNEQWLKKISEICHTYFSAGRDLSLLKHCSVLGVVPSSSAKQIAKAYRLKAKECHPDKKKAHVPVESANAAFRTVKEAQAALLDAAKARESCHARAFDGLLRNVGHVLREKLRECLAEQRYASVNELLFQLPGISELASLVSPPLDSRKISEDIIEAVKSHVDTVKIEVDSNWSARNYRLLNDNITDLKLMESHLKSHADVFATSWNNGIVETIESQIDALGKKGKEFLTDKRTAKKNEDDFRRCLVEMGSVLVELPAFKNYTKRVMCDVLAASLQFEWGYSYLFELGLSLQRGDGDLSDDEARVAHMILAEFSHFKEVMTMAWNTETTQKPVEDTVGRIVGRDLFSHDPLPIDSKALLECFESFESMYKKLLGEYIRPNADLGSLVAKTKSVCAGLQPIPCDGGWGRTSKQKLPVILAGVFALFTICKSGESFNRMEDSDEASALGDKILMKPHNIQVLTLLYMFGCGSPSSSSLESQLLQIRTGEGKSMILGAAAAVLGLLGYNVRCVCYSDYLSNRDFALFKDVFVHFGLDESVKYSKITSLSEDSTAAKGDIRGLTNGLLRGDTVQQNSGVPSARASRLAAAPVGEEITFRTTRSKALQKEKTPRRTRSSNSRQVRTEEAHRPCDVVTSDKPVDSSCLQEMSPESNHSRTGPREEILLVDEVDVFFGSEFYGQTYNQVAQLREPEIANILKAIWTAYKQVGRRQRLADIKRLPEYGRLVKKLKGFEFLVDNEISLMLDQVRRVDDEEYFLDSNDRIGYKVMDSVSFNVTYGYRTVFAYLKESDKGKLKQNDNTLQKVLCMNVSCGQFSYANIKPARILGVSGTLEAMGEFERKALSKYGIEKFLFMPSVYGKSNFEFQKAGEGILIEDGKSDFYHRLSSEITKLRKKNRAVIVFFRDAASLNAFENSPFYRKLGRQKSKLSEDMEADDKDFVIKKAATAGQLTICPAVFGRGTDFFCKDQKVLDNGGVHIIQTFLSAEKSEEIQIQGRTARQGREGTYQMILLDSDLAAFGIDPSDRGKLTKDAWYDWLCKGRDKHYSAYCAQIQSNLEEATQKDTATHKYFDALLQSKLSMAHTLFKDIYLTMKKRPMPSNIEIDLGFIVDVTGSMGPYIGAARRTIGSLLTGSTSIATKLGATFPDIEFSLRVATMAYRDIDDKENKFQESSWRGGRHFTETAQDAIGYLENATKNPSGGFDLAEDHLAAIEKCTNWTDWASGIKFMMLLTDAPAHGMVPAGSAHIANADSYSVRHPLGLTADSIVDGLLGKEIDLFFCSFNPLATAATEEKLASTYLNHPDNTEEREITMIHMVEKRASQPGVPELAGGYGQHIVFVLDQSGSMSHSWSGVVAAYRNYIDRRMQNQSQSDLVSVVQFDGSSTITVQNQPIGTAPTTLSYSGGGTIYSPAATDARRVALGTPSSHAPVVVFMSDGETDQGDATAAAQTFSALNNEIRRQRGHDLELHVIAFGVGLNTRQLQQITNSSPQGRLYTSANTAELSNIFVDIAKSSQDVSKVLEAEIGRRISDAVSDKLSMEYLG